MAKLDLISTPISRDVIPKINDSITYITSAINNLNSGPDGFDSFKVSACYDSLVSIKNNLYNEIDWLNNSISALTGMEDYQAKTASVLSINKIDTRNSRL